MKLRILLLAAAIGARGQTPDGIERMRQAALRYGDRLQLGHHGTVWSDCATGEVTRFYTETGLGYVRRMRTKAAVGYRLEVRYEPVKIGDREFLLPQTAVQNAVFHHTWTKAEIRFENYRKYDASSRVTFEKEK
jgi:hypothetical protein